MTTTLTLLRKTCDIRQARYDTTRAHMDLCRLYQAKHALLAAEVGL